MERSVVDLSDYFGAMASGGLIDADVVPREKDEPIQRAVTTISKLTRADYWRAYEAEVRAQYDPSITNSAGVVRRSDINPFTDYQTPRIQPDQDDFISYIESKRRITAGTVALATGTALSCSAITFVGIMYGPSIVENVSQNITQWAGNAVRDVLIWVPSQYFQGIGDVYETVGAIIANMRGHSSPNLEWYEPIRALGSLFVSVKVAEAVSKYKEKRKK